jgi:hypothetical protein
MTHPLSPTDDRAVLRVMGWLVGACAMFLAAIMLAGALGWLSPTCDGRVVTRTATCSDGAQPARGDDRVNALVPALTDVVFVR